MSITRALILAAGSARRLKPHTNDRPKCMLEVGGRPILAHQVAALRLGGVSDIGDSDLICIGGYYQDRRLTLYPHLRALWRSWFAARPESGLMVRK